MSRVVAFGEIMGRLAAPGFKRFQQAMPGALEVTFAGAEASIAASIAYLGGDAAFVTALPAHAVADACLADLRSLNVDTRHILRTAQGRLGLYFLEAGANQRPGNVIYDREGSAVAITPASAYDWPAIFAGAR
ncbi:MAG: PfkB family carbohydrate kinase [Limisphaerales bacterium]